ncbi:MAG: hypothetical protein H7832_03655 [Magnetococcus sp. DMHC-6]
MNIARINGIGTYRAMEATAGTGRQFQKNPEKFDPYNPNGNLNFSTKTETNRVLFPQSAYRVSLSQSAIQQSKTS